MFQTFGHYNLVQNSKLEIQKPSVRIALAQINPTVGDLEGNARKIKQWIRRAEKARADIVVFPELAVTGYPPEDLLLKPKFVADNIAALRSIAKSCPKNITAIAGFVDSGKLLNLVKQPPAGLLNLVKQRPSGLYNAAAVLVGGKIVGVYYKTLLPNYGVFDEKRYFRSGSESLVFTDRCGSQTSAGLRKSGFRKFGVVICEDIWFKDGPVKDEAKLGAKIIFALNASPYHAGKIKEREKVVRDRARENKVAIAYVNMVGGQDELVFDGQSMLLDDNGEVIARAAAFREEILVVDTDVTKSKVKSQNLKPLSLVEEIYQALVLGLCDYVRKNGFRKVVIGLSGGIDSSLVATLAVDALGKENVVGVAMPSRFSSRSSLEDAKELARNLGIKLLTIPIEKAFTAYLQTLKSSFRGRKPDVTEENIQARIRGNLLMALSNKFYWLVLTTGNKSEMSVGYATLYGDMAGGFAVIKDVPKTLIYKLAEWRNSLKRVIPDRVLVKAPSAELRPGQKDTDSLPPYEVLDPILKAYVEEDKSVSEIGKMGFSPAVVKMVASMVDRNEYKRRQAPPGIKITPKAFGRDRRMPITNYYKQ